MVTLYNDRLSDIDAILGSSESSQVPLIFKDIPLDIFGQLLLDVPSIFPSIRTFFPSMPSKELQNLWTGSHGEILLTQSLAAVRSITSGYSALTGRNIYDATVLDYGCGWGRLIRLLYKYLPSENIYAVDPWDESIKHCREHRVRANLAISDWIPRTLPFEHRFDLIFAFSVFTHLSKKTAHIVLDTLRKHVSHSGLLVITIRPREYWSFHEGGHLSSKMIPIHDEHGYAFVPHNRPPVEGEVTYGDTSMSLEYLAKNLPNWKILASDYNLVDPYQIMLFLKPA